MKKKVAVIIAHEGYQSVEYGKTKQELEKAGYLVTTVSDLPGTATAVDDSTTAVDTTIESLDPVKYDAVVFIGGAGALEHLDTNMSYKKIQDAHMAGKVVAAICIATRILAKAGALVTKNATGWNGDGLLPQVYDEHGVIYDDAPVITDGRVVTARGPQEAEAFGHALVELLG